MLSTLHCVGEILGFALQRSADSRRDDLRGDAGDEIGRHADRDVLIQIEVNRHRGKLVDVVHVLRPERFVPRRHRRHRNQPLPVIGLHVQHWQDRPECARSASAASRIT